MTGHNQTMTRLTATQIRDLLHLDPHPIEGGFFIRTYQSPHKIPQDALPPGYQPGAQAGSETHRLVGTAIYYLLTPETFSAMHRLPGDEIFHFYLGDPVEMLQLPPDGSGETIILGHDFARGMRPQHVVPGGVWQGSGLIPGGEYALLGTTMSPGFDYADYET